MRILPEDITRQTVAHFVHRPHHDKWLVRIASSLVIIGLIYALEGIWAGALGLLWFVAVLATELRAYRNVEVTRLGVETASDAEAGRQGARLLVHATFLAALYSLPVYGLSFGTESGQVFGLILGASILMNITAQHIIHQRQVFFSLPVPALGFLLCALALAGQNPWVIGFVVLIYGVQTIFLTRAASRTSANLLEAQARAVTEAHARGLADSANQTKSAFLATMSHELRTPLNAVIGYGEILRENAEFEERSEDVADIDKVLTSAKGLLNLVHEVLDMAAIQAGSLLLYPKECDVQGEIEARVAVAQALLKDQTRKINVQANGPLGKILCDSERLGQCVAQLLANAIKFSTSGDINVTTWRTSSAIFIRVADQGIGITPETQAIIFEPFTQVDASSTRQYNGAGLGLALTASLARLMGGDVSVTSELSVGSVFTLTIPLQPPADKPIPAVS